MADPTEAEETDAEEGQAPKRNWRRDLEDRADKAEARAEAAERRAALAEAGLTSLNEKQRKALLAAHDDGEMSAEALKATAAELGFGAKDVTEGASSETTETEPEVDPALASEAQELATLSNSPAVHTASKDVIRTQEAFDAKVRSFDNERDLDAFLRENLHLLPQGQRGN